MVLLEPRTRDASKSRDREEEQGPFAVNFGSLGVRPSTGTCLRTHRRAIRGRGGALRTCAARCERVVTRPPDSELTKSVMTIWFGFFYMCRKKIWSSDSAIEWVGHGWHGDSISPGHFFEDQSDRFLDQSSMHARFAGTRRFAGMRGSQGKYQYEKNKFMNMEGPARRPFW